MLYNKRFGDKLLAYVLSFYSDTSTMLTFSHGAACIFQHCCKKNEKKVFIDKMLNHKNRLLWGKVIPQKTRCTIN